MYRWQKRTCPPAGLAAGYVRMRACLVLGERPAGPLTGHPLGHPSALSTSHQCGALSPAETDLAFGSKLVHPPTSQYSATE
ncbi:hypothetical protein T265_09339 [Opisthorchis viverrini]|uniref:Uncharacterized protein n=1 Tax=Opisthorchis viverrini TaxID=6198 RepID=A0A074ZHB1_OPIVI|nr:hypothetical protein T265_09339 [Opisthorchis viverrini]KER22605.1 hypothetical protein T265_09339 [Opisthorchis viverrini]